MNCKVFYRSILFLVLAILLSCTAYRYQNIVVEKYIPPDPKKIDNSKIYNTTFDKAWEAIVGAFAINNFQIKTINKESGIISAEVFYNESDHLDIIDTGQTEILTFRITEKMRPRGFYGSGNPAYIRKYGKVADKKKELINHQYKKSKYPVKTYFNIFAQKVSGGIKITLNTKMEGLEKINGENPSPQSTGIIEYSIFQYINNQLK